MKKTYLIVMFLVLESIILAGLVAYYLLHRGSHTEAPSQVSVEEIIPSPTGTQVLVHIHRGDEAELAVADLSTKQLIWRRYLARSRDFASECNWKSDGSSFAWAWRPKGSFGLIYVVDPNTGQSTTYDLQDYPSLFVHGFMRMLFDPSLTWFTGVRVPGRAGPPNLVEVGKVFAGRLTDQDVQELDSGAPVAIAADFKPDSGVCWLMYVKHEEKSKLSAQVWLTRLPDRKVRIPVTTCQTMVALADQAAISTGGEFGFILQNRIEGAQAHSELEYFSQNATEGTHKLQLPDYIFRIYPYKGSQFFAVGHQAWLLDASKTGPEAKTALAQGKRLPSRGACLLPDGRLLVADEKKLEYWDAATGQAKAVLTLPEAGPPAEPVADAN